MTTAALGAAAAQERMKRRVPCRPVKCSSFIIRIRPRGRPCVGVTQGIYPDICRCGERLCNSALLAPDVADRECEPRNALIDLRRRQRAERQAQEAFATTVREERQA